MPDKVLLSDIDKLTFTRGRTTRTRRRAWGVNQLICDSGGSAGCRVDCAFHTAVCYNRGHGNGATPTFECSAQLPGDVALGVTKVTCEGYDSVSDPYVLVGSCGLTYTLEGPSRSPVAIVVLLVYVVVWLIMGMWFGIDGYRARRFGSELCGDDRPSPPEYQPLEHGVDYDQIERRESTRPFSLGPPISRQMTTERDLQTEIPPVARSHSQETEHTPMTGRPNTIFVAYDPQMMMPRRGNGTTLVPVVATAAMASDSGPETEYIQVGPDYAEIAPDFDPYSGNPVENRRQNLMVQGAGLSHPVDAVAIPVPDCSEAGLSNAEEMEPFTDSAPNVEDGISTAAVLIARVDPRPIPSRWRRDRGYRT